MSAPGAEQADGGVPDSETVPEASSGLAEPTSGQSWAAHNAVLHACSSPLTSPGGQRGVVSLRSLNRGTTATCQTLSCLCSEIRALHRSSIPHAFARGCGALCSAARCTHLGFIPCPTYNTLPLQQNTVPPCARARNHALSSRSLLPASMQLTGFTFLL